MRRLAISLIVLPWFVSAQYSPEYKYLEKSEKVEIETSRSNFNASVKISEKGQFLKSTGTFMAKRSVSYDNFRQISDLRAYTTDPINNLTYDVDHFEDHDRIAGISFYSDSKIRDFTFPQAREGMITNLHYSENHTGDIPFSHLFLFGSYFPVDRAALTVTFPKHVEIGYHLFNCEGLDIDFSKTESKDGWEYEWSVENLDGYRGDDGINEARLFYTPHVILYVKKLTFKGKEVSVLGGVDDLYSWYSHLIAKIDDRNLEEVKQIADEITMNMVGEKAKAAAIFNWVQDNINYVAFGDGFGGFIPRGAASICQKKYGDCKDMSHVMYVMLNHVGIDAFHTWVGSRNKPYLYEENPTPLVDDHMITTAVVDGDTVFLDGTDNFIRFGYPSAFTQNKEVLIGFDDRKYTVSKVPVVKPSANRQLVHTDITIDGSRLLVREDRKLTGFEKVEFIMDYLHNKNTDTDEEFLNHRLELGNNKTKYNQIEISGLDNDNDTLSLSYELDIQNYARVIGNKLLINLNIDRTLDNGILNPDNIKYSRKFDHKFERSFSTKVKIPEGYRISKLPEDLAFENEDYSLQVSYLLENDVVLQQKNITINTISIPASEFDSWNEFIKTLLKAYKRTIVFEKK